MQKEGALYARDCLQCSLLIEEKQKVTIIFFLALELEMLQFSRKILQSSHKALHCLGNEYRQSALAIDQIAKRD